MSPSRATLVRYLAASLLPPLGILVGLLVATGELDKAAVLATLTFAFVQLVLLMAWLVVGLSRSPAVEEPPEDDW